MFWDVLKFLMMYVIFLLAFGVLLAGASGEVIAFPNSVLLAKPLSSFWF